MRRVRRAGLLIAACVVVAAAWMLVPGPDGSAAVDDARARAEVASDEPIVELVASETPESPLLTADSIPNPRIAADVHVPVELDARALKSSAKPAPRVDSGKLTVRAVDAATRELLDRLHVRAGSAQRLADRKSGLGETEVVLKLTPDTYTTLVLIPGYEPTELAPVRVDKGAEIVLHPAEMRRGSASILGLVTGSVTRSASFAELAGAGRRPCVLCADWADVRHSSGTRATGTDAGWNRNNACAECGYAAELTRIPVDPTGQFVFAHLVSGTYLLRLTDDRGHTDGTRTVVVLNEAQRVVVEIVAPELRDVLVNLIDVDEVSLSTSWSAIVRAAARAEDSDTFDANEIIGDLVWQFAVHEGGEFLGLGSFSTPTRADFTAGGTSTFSGRKRGTSRSVDDRTRGSDEDLRPPEEPPKLPEVVFESIVREDGLVRIAGLPSQRLSLRLTCEPFTTTATVPESIGIVTVRAPLVRSPERRVDDRTDPATFQALDAARYR